MQHTEGTTNRLDANRAMISHGVYAVLISGGVTHLLAARTPGDQPHGVVAALDLVGLLTHV